MVIKKIPIIVVCGATASGKTALSIEIAREFGGEIVSADSMQIYRHMDIGSAKPTIEERQGVAHHMMDILEPTESFSAAQYAEMAHRCIYDIYSRKRLPVMAGGTGLYINSVINDVDFSDEDNSDGKLRNELTKIYEENGAEYLHEMLRAVDEKSAEKIHANNVKRVIRAIEFYRLNNKKLSEHSDEGKLKESRYMPIMLEISWDRAELYERINRRVDIMFEAGLENEVRELIKMGCTREMTSMQGIGYKETADYIDGKITLDEAKEQIKQGSRRYAKRQLTWFRRDERIISLSPENCVEEAFDIIKKQIKN